MKIFGAIFGADSMQFGTGESGFGVSFLEQLNMLKSCL